MIITKYPGTLGALGFGQHAFASGGAGTNELLVRNTTPGTANKAAATIQADGSGVLSLEMFSTTHTPSGPVTAAGGRMVLTGAGTFGIETVASGGLRFFPGGSLRASIDFTNGLLSENEFGVKIKNTGGTAIDGVVITASNQMNIGSDSAASMNDTTVKAGQSIRFRTNGAERMSISSAGVVAPTGAGTQDFGTVSARWNVAYVNSIDTGDVVFDNRFKLTEHDKVGIRTRGMALCNSAGDIVAFFDERGHVYARKFGRLSELHESERRGY
jgi:hypothetical protein